MRRIPLLIFVSFVLVCCSRQSDFHVVLQNGLVCDGAGSPCTSGGISGDKIAKIRHVFADCGRIDIDVHGKRHIAMAQSTITGSFLSACSSSPRGKVYLPEYVEKHLRAAISSNAGMYGTITSSHARASYLFATFARYTSK